MEGGWTGGSGWRSLKSKIEVDGASLSPAPGAEVGLGLAISALVRTSASKALLIPGGLRSWQHVVFRSLFGYIRLVAVGAVH